MFDSKEGLFTTGKFILAGKQLLGALVMVFYAAGVSYIFFSILSLMNRFRIGDTIEIVGMDILDYSIKNEYKIAGTTVTKEQILQLEEK